jgi:hypothetical protein
MPEDTLLKNRNSIERSFVRTVDRPDQKRGKLPPDRRDFKFQFNERDLSQDRSAIFSCLKGLKRALKETRYVFGSPEGKTKSDQDPCK